MGVVYKINFPDGKAYVGSTIISLKVRIQEHKAQAKHSINPMATAIVKAVYNFGIDISMVEILHEETDIKKLRDVEKQFINSANTTFPNGYNMNPCVKYSEIYNMVKDFNFEAKKV